MNMHPLFAAASGDGESRKRKAMDNHEAHRAEIILQARRRFVSHALSHGTVTTDDARDGLSIPEGVDPVCLGAVPGGLARKGIIRRTGYIRSKRPEAHARPLSVWQLQDAGKARAWLDANPTPEAHGLGQSELPLNEEPGRANARETR
jgi:hypothetical protein